MGCDSSTTLYPERPARSVPTSQPVRLCSLLLYFLYFFCLPSSVSSSKFRISQLLCLALYKNCRGAYQQFPTWKIPNCTRKELSARVCVQVLSFHILAHSFAPKKTQLLPFQAIPHSLLKNTGSGVPTFSSMWPRLIASKVE